MTTKSEPVVTIFRSRLRREALVDYERWAVRMEALAAQMPGFVSIKTFAAADGERLSIVEFTSDAAALAWHAHPEHREAQRLGRERFYAEFEVITCAPLRRYAFKAEG